MTGNPSNDPVLNLKRLPEIKIAAQRPLPWCSRRFISGDYPGLSRLAGDLNDFATKCNAEITRLAEYVEKIVGDTGRWKGRSAQRFRASFGGDAILMHGLARAAATAAQVIDNLAYKLAVIESQIEARMDTGVRSGHFSINPKQQMGDVALRILATELKSGTVPVVRAGSGLAGQRAGLEVGTFCERALAAAARCREEAASQLAVLGATVSNSLDVYTKNYGGDVEGKLLLPYQISMDSHINARLQAQFQAAGQAAGIDSADVNKAASTFQKWGGEAAEVGEVVADFKGWKRASTVARVGGVVIDMAGLALKVVK